jgi:signal recognition particle receptor subunit beta
MATINFATREISAKVVYFGATGAGCNTNLERLHALLDVKSKSALHRFGPGDSEERSLFFDYRSPDAGPVEAFALTLAVYSLPGGISLAAHRDEVLREVDGVVFVADARVDRNPANVDALLELESLLGSVGLDISDLPVVIQVNHVDDDQARRIDDVVFDLNPFGFAVVRAVARQDEGVVATHAEVVTALSARIGHALSDQTPGLRLTAVHDPNRPSDAEVVRAHIEQIALRAAVTPEVEEVLDRIAPLDEAQLEALIDALPDGPTVEIAFQPRELVGSHPARILGAQVQGDQVHVELLMERMGGAEQRRLTVVLANRPADSEPLPRPTRASPPSPLLDDDDEELDEDLPDVFDFLPQDDLPLLVTREPEDLPGVWYGILGVASGILIGLLSGYLVLGAQ